MLIKIAHPRPIKPSEITAEAIYADRRHMRLHYGAPARRRRRYGSTIPAISQRN